MNVAENYSNLLYEGHACRRYWVTPRLLVGGSILGPEDFAHLERDFGITHVVNVETEHDDTGKVPAERLLQARVPDLGGPFPPEAVLSVCLFVSRAMASSQDPRFYVHCQQGGSRSPGFAYAVLRGVFGLPRDDARREIVAARDGDYGHHQFHLTYMDSVDRALSLLP